LGVSWVLSRAPRVTGRRTPAGCACPACPLSVVARTVPAQAVLAWAVCAPTVPARAVRRLAVPARAGPARRAVPARAGPARAGPARALLRSLGARPARAFTRRTSAGGLRDATRTAGGRLSPAVTCGPAGPGRPRTSLRDPRAFRGTRARARALRVSAVCVTAPLTGVAATSAARSSSPWRSASLSHANPTSSVCPNSTQASEEGRSTSLGATLFKHVRRRPTLPRGPPRSTIGAEELNFRVRNGTGCFPFAITAETLLRCHRPRGPLRGPGTNPGTSRWRPYLRSRTVDAKHQME
jgi:hypothetical protein